MYTQHNNQNMISKQQDVYLVYIFLHINFFKFLLRFFLFYVQETNRILANLCKF